jgi:hypothetical protein
MPEISMTCNTLTGSYEALAMYSFGRYLIGCLGTSSPKSSLKKKSRDEATMEHAIWVTLQFLCNAKN